MLIGGGSLKADFNFRRIDMSVNEIVINPSDLMNAPHTQTINSSVRALRQFQIDVSKEFIPNPDTVKDVNGKPVTSGIIGFEKDAAGNVSKVHFVNPKDSGDKYAKQSYPVKDGVLILPGQNEAQVAKINALVDGVVGNKSTLTLADFDKVLKAAHQHYTSHGAIPDIYNSDRSQLDPAKHIKLGENSYQKVARPETMYLVEAPTGKNIGFQGSVSKDGHMASAQYSSGSFVVITGTDPKTNEPYARKLALEYAQQNLRDATTGKPLDFKAVPKISVDEILAKRTGALHVLEKSTGTAEGSKVPPALLDKAWEAAQAHQKWAAAAKADVKVLTEPAKEITHPKVKPGQGGFIAIGEIANVGLTHLKGGLLGVAGAGAGAAAAVEAHKGVGAALNAAAEAILPGSSTSGNDVCKVAGTVIGGVAGTVAAAGAGALTFGGTAIPTTPVGATVLSVAAGGAAYSVTQPVAKQATEALCNTVLPDSVKAAAGKAIAAINSALSFGGSDKAPQNPHKQVVADAGKGIKN